MANEDTRYRSQEYNSAERDKLEGGMRASWWSCQRERWSADRQ